MTGDPKPYFSARQGRPPDGTSLPFETVRRLIVSVFDELRERGYLTEAFGYDCVDGDRLGTIGADPDAFFLRTVGREHIWPYWHVDTSKPRLMRHTWAEGWDADTLFDVVEVVHDLVSAPTGGYEHDYLNCGYHHTSFDTQLGQADYRVKVKCRPTSP